MKKVEQLHLDAINANICCESNYAMVLGKNDAASKAAEITEQIAIEFAEWCNKPNLEDSRQGNVVYVPSGNFYWHKHVKYTPKELFQEFLKTK